MIVNTVPVFRFCEFPFRKFQRIAWACLLSTNCNSAIASPAIRFEKWFWTCLASHWSMWLLHYTSVTDSVIATVQPSTAGPSGTMPRQTRRRQASPPSCAFKMRAVRKSQAEYRVIANGRRLSFRHGEPRHHLLVQIAVF